MSAGDLPRRLAPSPLNWIFPPQHLPAASLYEPAGDAGDAVGGIVWLTIPHFTERAPEFAAEVCLRWNSHSALVAAVAAALGESELKCRDVREQLRAALKAAGGMP